MSVPEQVHFFFPYREVSGVPMLFLRLAQELAARYSLKTGIIDFPDGYMARNVPSGSPVELIPFNYRRVCEVDSSTLLILQTMQPYKFPASLKPARSTRIIFWTLFQYNLSQPTRPSGRSTLQGGLLKTMRRLLAELVDARKRRFVREAALRMAERRSLWFADEPNVRAVSAVLRQQVRDPIVIPVPSEDVENNLKLKYERKHDRLAVGWLGRLCDFKIHILAYTIRKVSQWAANRMIPVTFTVIGDGPEAHLLDGVSQPHAFFELKRAGRLEGAAVTTYLLEHIDVMAAMGTAALDAMRLGIPTLRLDPSYEPVVGDYRYEWFWEKKEINLGDFITPENFEKDNRSLEDRLDSVICDYESLSRASLECYKGAYSSKSVCEKFLANIKEAKFCYGDFKPEELRKGGLRSVYEWLAYRCS